MPSCSNIVIWEPIPANSRFCAQASGTSTDFLVGVRIVGADGSDTQFRNGDLVPGPAHRSLTSQQYATRITLTPGASAPTVTMNAWIEDSTGSRIFECTWSASAAVTAVRVTVITVPASA
jgi:hypothetical protein